MAQVKAQGEDQAKAQVKDDSQAEATT